ncbi:MAG: type I-C CRISPR-associated protein Cas8c/Csd1 [Bacteroidetes bacterium]|nr:type I-C CRISPR-associated protein Cas8c/Csd1 [Bacteroidota bacterium]
MIRELVQLAERNRKDEPYQPLVHDALCKERVDAYICIAPDGTFLDMIPTEKKETVAEDLVRTENKGRTSNVLARLVLDNEKYVLGLPKSPRNTKCHKAYVAKLHEYENLPAVKPLINFYEKKENEGLKDARKAYQSQVESKQLKQGTNFSFMIRSKKKQETIVHMDSDLIKTRRKSFAIIHVFGS